MDAFDHLFIAPSDFAASLAFYRDRLGWTVRGEWGGDDEPRGATLTASGGMSVTIAEPHPDREDHAWEVGAREHRPTLHLKVDDADARFEALGAGEVVQPPEDTHWGTRWFVVADPDGNLIAWNGPQKI